MLGSTSISDYGLRRRRGKKGKAGREGGSDNSDSDIGCDID